MTSPLEPAMTRSSQVNESLITHRRNWLVQPLLTDMYQVSMAYAYWKAGKATNHAVYTLFFRKNPFGGEFTLFAGLEDCLHFLENFQYSDSDISYLKSIMPASVESEFFAYLSHLRADDVVVSALEEGQVAFPRTPLLIVEGPLIVCQLLETTLLNLVNFASLMTTNAARYRLAAGNSIKLLEFGLRRSQGPDGGLSASKYAYMGGFDGTSNVLAGKLFQIPVNGTHAHAFITSFAGFDDLNSRCLPAADTGAVCDGQQEFNNGTDNGTDEARAAAAAAAGADAAAAGADAAAAAAAADDECSQDLLAGALSWRARIAQLLQLLPDEANCGELAAFISFALAFPRGFLALIDTYDVHRSGLLNFCAVSLALNDLGYRPLGIRIDSGDLAYLSRKARETFETLAVALNLPWFADLVIVASNDINEETIISLNEQGHKINCFGIGTHLVTCQRQPALGCVYKQVEINGSPCMKLSQDVEKVTIPGRTHCYRLYGSDGLALIDLLMRHSEPAPQVGGDKKTLCHHPFQEKKRTFVCPSRVANLHKVYWQDGRITQSLPSLHDVRDRVQRSLASVRSDIRRHLNPTPYKVSVSTELYRFLHDLWLERAPIGELR